jgi:ribulose-bisphosphate carboxylase large chain
VFSSGQTAAQAGDTYRALGNADLIYAAGGGIMAHPDGPAGGVAGLRAAWEAAMGGAVPAGGAGAHRHREDAAAEVLVR